jgi:hypothetical protein
MYGSTPLTNENDHQGIHPDEMKGIIYRSKPLFKEKGSFRNLSE